jgi:hypothetical protein
MANMSNDPGFSEMISAFLEIGRMTRGTVEFQTGLYAAIMQAGTDTDSPVSNRSFKRIQSSVFNKAS